MPWGGQSHSGFPRLFDEMYDPALLIDPDGGKILLSNRAARAFLGYTAGELSRLTPSDIHPHELPRLSGFLKNVLDHGRWSADELSCRTKQGDPVPAELRASAVEIDGRVLVLIVIHDLRSRRLAEVGQSVRKLAHDLRNALSTTQLLSDRLRNHEDQAVRTNAAAILRTLERVNRMCHDIQRAGAVRERVPHRTRFLLVDVIEEIIHSAQLPEQTGPRVVEGDGGDILLDADFDQVYRICLNLVRNAIDAGASTVMIGGHVLDGCAVIEVADDGPGLPPFVKEQIETGKPSHAGGGGLGLLIANELAGNHGGRLRIGETGPGRTRLLVSLPAA